MNLKDRFDRWHLQRKIAAEFRVKNKRIFAVTESIKDMPIDVYEAHCRELAIRVEEGWELESPTTAEVAGFLVKKFQRIDRLPPDEVVLFERLTERMFPETDRVADRMHDPLGTKADTKLSSLKRLLRVDWRK